MLTCRRVAPAAVAALLALSGCSGGSSGGSHTGSVSGGATGASTTSTVDVAARYQVSVRAADNATCTFSKAVAALGNNAKVRETKGLVPSVINALRRFRRELGDIPWPDAAKRDAADLQQATDAVISDIEALPQQSPAGMSAWTQKTQKDKAGFAAATRSLRSHTGLLPLAADTCT